MDSEKIVEAQLVEPPKRPFFHPFSGALILGVDWLAFGLDLVSGAGALALTSAAAFFVTFYGIRRIQLDQGDGSGRATLKALLGGLAAGAPFPIGGTVVGAAILVLSGLRRR